MMSKKKLINAIYDLGTGKTMLAHPDKENVFVSPAHYKEITSGMHAESNCTYTTETVCSVWQKEAHSDNMVCIKEKEIQTCNCSCDH